MIRVINIVDNILPINAGIWKAAVSTAGILKSQYEIQSELWFPHDKEVEETLEANHFTPFPLMNLKKKNVLQLIKEKKLNPENTIIVSHGCWQYPTIWANEFKKSGFSWVYVPQGMLEPWSLNQKKIIKYIYYNLQEYPFTNKADTIRAVSSPEAEILSRKYTNVKMIPNGVELPALHVLENKTESPVICLFMARLHYKKGIIPLVKGWLKSELNNNLNYKLIIAGPDQGELSTITDLIEPSLNIEYVGIASGKLKQELLTKSSFYILPSFSEGFPTSVIEAMSYGVIPLISVGCNFPEAIQQEMAFQISPNEEDILVNLNVIKSLSEDSRINLSKSIREFIFKDFTLERIAKEQSYMYKKILDKNNGKPKS